MAHRCWALDEIVRAIAANLVTNWATASAVALACCSKSFEEPALGEIWRRLTFLDGLDPLIKCFPPEVWEIRGEDRKLYFRRAPLRAEWTRFQRYASKVQDLLVYFPDISLAALHLLQLYSHDCPLLPNLVSLDWASDEKRLPFISMFISPSLTSIDISMPRKANPMLPPIFNKLSTLSPDIKKIETDQLFHDPSMEEASSQLLMQCNHLRTFKVDSPISTSALRHSIQLPSLEEFCLVVSSFQLPDPLPIVVFPSLRQLVVKGNGDPTWLKLLPAIENPVLAIITVQCTGLDVERFMETFQLTVTGCGIHECLREFTVNSPDNFKITPRIMACNLSCKNLTSLKLVSDCSNLCQTSDLTDDDIDLFTKGMPCLEYLAVGGVPCNVPSQITFKSLYTISRRCTRLRDLEIHFNPALFVTKVGMDSESWHVALGLSDFKTLSSDLCSITTISVGDIPLPAQSNASCVMALGLLGVFPCLEFVFYDNNDWRNVQDLIGVCRRMGPFAFGKG